MEIKAKGDPTQPLPWIPCAIDPLSDYDFICPDCSRPICYDHGEELDDEESGTKIWVCVECINGEPWYPLRGISEEPEEPLTIDSKTGLWVNLVTRDQEEFKGDDINTVQMYIDLIDKLFFQ